jgi:pantoate--beta-alanine ligase
MRVIERISDLKAILRTQRKTGKSVGFVPTMGYLHDGHLSLVETSKKENDFTVMSIFVNPAQFGVNEDFDKYPRDMESDSQKAASAGVDIIFAPSVNEMYPEGYNTFVEVSEITDKLCGKSRPEHFKGVTTVVSKLLNIVEPDKAYFGQKDAQQAIVIEKMVKDLNMGVEIVICPIVREKDGLAMSSRNVYLNAEERKAAVVLSKSLFNAEIMIKDGERNVEKVYSCIFNIISSENMASIDYISIVNAETLENIKMLKGKVLVALAVKFGKTRLIDNIIVEVL